MMFWASYHDVTDCCVSEREERERQEQEQREEEEREYQERLRKLEEQERKQRARQQEIEERERRKEEELRRPQEEKSSKVNTHTSRSWLVTHSHAHLLAHFFLTTLFVKMAPNSLNVITGCLEA